MKNIQLNVKQIEKALEIIGKLHYPNDYEKVTEELQNASKDLYSLLRWLSICLLDGYHSNKIEIEKELTNLWRAVRQLDSSSTKENEDNDG